MLEKFLQYIVANNLQENEQQHLTVISYCVPYSVPTVREVALNSNYVKIKITTYR